MAKTLDMTTVPAVVTILNENTAPAEAARDNNDFAHDFASDANVQMFNTNLYVTLAAGDTLKILAQTSTELLYYTLMDGKNGLKVTSAAK